MIKVLLDRLCCIREELWRKITLSRLGQGKLRTLTTERAEGGDIMAVGDHDETPDY